MIFLLPLPLKGEDWGEGGLIFLPLIILTQTSKNLVKNGIGFFQDLIIPEPNNPIPVWLQPEGTLTISQRCLHMLTAIDFNDQIFLKAYEIDNIFSYGCLAAGFEISQLAVF